MRMIAMSLVHGPHVSTWVRYSDISAQSVEIMPAGTSSAEHLGCQGILTANNQTHLIACPTCNGSGETIENCSHGYFYKQLHCIHGKYKEHILE